MAKDYYQVLGINRDASQEQIKTAYRKLAFEHHPDRNKEDQAAGEKMKEINEAYAVLSDQRKRNEYNAYRDSYGSSASQRFRDNYSEEDIFRDSDINQIFEEMSKMFGFRNFDEIFKEFYGSKYRTFSFRSPGFFGKGFISFHGFRSQAEQRGKFQERDNVPPFPTYPPAGFLTRFLMRRVERALGVKFPERGRDQFDILPLDPKQVHKGGRVKYSRPGWGKPQKIMVKIPPGIKDGQKIRLKGLGAVGKNGGEAGDLYLQIKIRTPILHRIKRLFKQ